MGSTFGTRGQLLLRHLALRTAFCRLDRVIEGRSLGWRGLADKITFDGTESDVSEIIEAGLVRSNFANPQASAPGAPGFNLWGTSALSFLGIFTDDRWVGTCKQKLETKNLFHGTPRGDSADRSTDPMPGMFSFRTPHIV